MFTKIFRKVGTTTLVGLRELVLILGVGVLGSQLMITLNGGAPIGVRAEAASSSAGSTQAVFSSIQSPHPFRRKNANYILQWKRPQPEGGWITQAFILYYPRPLRQKSLLPWWVIINGHCYRLVNFFWCDKDNGLDIDSPAGIDYQ